ncbi:hypothetical protein BWI17_21595 [Betaproteobacteria bacterium GR16-43]|nr:hypothetical protein BWI17_21595 [Betaproteobacteria bacterium GR16-43]
MTKAQRLLVITENGRVVGTQFISPPVNGVPSVSVGLQCGPGQGLHEIEMEPPTALRTLEQFHQFHEDVAKKLGAEKLYRK